MKKILLLLLMAMSVCLGGFAQKGRQAVGVDFPFRGVDGTVSYGFGLKYQYNITDYIGVEPFFQYYVQEEDSEYKIVSAINGNIYFLGPNRFRPYVFLGTGYARVCEDLYEGTGGYQDYDNGMLIQSGFAFDYRISYSWSWQLVIGGQMLLGTDNFSSIYASTGFTYNF